MRLITTVCLCLCVGFGSANAQQNAPPSFACIPDPQLEVWHHTQSENGKSDLTVMYHANHTFEFSALVTGGYTALSTTNPIRMYLPEANRHNYGTWENRCTQFCWVESLGSNAGKEICKVNGHYIGRDPIPGWPQSKGSSR